VVRSVVPTAHRQHTTRTTAHPPTHQGNREVIDGMAPGSAKVLESVLKLVDAFDLYGRWVLPTV